MAELLNKDPVTYERERDNFLKDLKHFHETRGTSFKKYPKISGKEVDLYLLYVLVTAHGGWIRVNSKNEWASLCEQFHLPSGCVNSGVGLKQIYLRYLDRYEKVNFLGEDGQQADEDDEDSRHRKWSARSLHSVPLTYNYHQHNIAESLREYNGLSADLYKPSNYDTLALSLLSPLPNEQDFAINVCTLLSNEGKHTLRLDKYPRLINILLAHAGVFDSPGTRQLFIEVYSRVRNYSINSFWADVLDSQDVIDLTDERLFIKKPQQDVKSFSRRRNGKDKQKNDESQVQSQAQSMDIDIDTCLSDCSRLDDIMLDMDDCRDQNQNSIKFEDEDKELFCVGRTLGTQDPYGQRVLQIASILRNLSFSAENAAVLGRNKCFLRFVLLCVRSRWSNLHQLGFDTLGNIANEIILKEAGQRVTDVILSCVSRGIESQDRFIVISCLEVMNKISQQDSNEEILSLGVDESVYTVICRFLALSDIALLVYTLECLYALTSLGERPCTNVARVRGAIDTLVALVTVEAQSYGPKSCILMKVVETVSTIATPNQNTTSNVSATSSPVQSSTSTVASAGTAPTTSTIAIAPVVATSTISTANNVVALSSISSSTPAPSPSPVTSRPSTPASNSSSKSNAQKVAESANSLQQQHAHQQIIQENEQFALGWLRATFELAPGSRIEQEELYKKYLGCCTKIGRRGVIAPLHFPRCVRTVFGGTIGPNPLKGETTGQQYYEGIRVRAQVGPITYLGQTVNTNSTGVGANAATVKVLPVLQQQQQRISTPNPNSHPDSTDNSGSMKTPSPASPILKAQLSAPPRPTSNNSPSPNAAFKAALDPMSQVSVAHPHLSQALLASGSQIQQSTVVTNQQPVTPQQQQQVVQVVVKDDSRGGVTSSSIIKSLLATKVTVSGDCMPGVAVTCVSSPTACVTNTTATSIASSISANQLITSNQVAQRQQQQRLLQQQLTGIIQPASPAATPALVQTKTPVNSKQKTTLSQTSGKKILRVNGAKVIMSNNVDKTEQNDSESANQSSPSTPENHISSNKSCQPLTVRPNQRSVCTPVAEDSDSTNNSLASSSGLGGSRDCSGVGAEEDNSLTSFEGILLNGAPTHGALDIDTQDDGSSKDSSLGSAVLIKDQKPLQNMMLADLLERKLDKEPIMNGVLAKNSINEKGLDIVENHIKKVLKEPPNEVKIKAEIDEGGTIKLKMEVSEDVPPEAACDTALIEAPRGLKRNTSDLSDEVDSKKTKYSNGTSTPEPDPTIATSESRASSVKSEEQDEDGEKATVSSTAAKLYADLAADCIEDELDEENNIQPKPEEVPVVVKEENAAIIVNSQIEQQLLQQQQQQQLIMAATPRQIVVQQALPNNQVIIPTSQVKTNVRTTPSQAQVGAASGLMGVLLQQSPGGQLQYVVSGGVPGQNYVLAQPQTALVQGQAQTVLVAQTTQQQGTATKTIIILQPQAATPQNATQKMVAVTPQGQQVVVTQMPRPMMQSPALGNIPPPLVPTSASIPHSIIVNSSVAQANPNTVTVTIPAIAQAAPLTSSVPSRVLTPSPSSTPPPRPAAPKTPQGTSVTPPPVNPTPVKCVKTEEADSKPSTSQTVTETKTITIKIDPNAFLCEWRGCLKQFKTAHEVYLHVCEAHCPTGNEEILCLWSSCDGLKRRRFSLMTHLYDRHCNADTMSSRRKQLTATGKTEVSTTIPATPHHPGYAPNAAFHAIKRHALEFVNPKELMQRPSKPAVATSSSSSPRPGQNPSPEQDDNEGPVTKSIRLTAALILRNLVIYSAYGRRHLRAYEPHLASVALSNVESSRTIAQVLYDMNDQSNSGPR